MEKYFFENEVYKTTISDKKDFVSVLQFDKITGIEHKIILQAEELERLSKIFNCQK